MKTKGKYSTSLKVGLLTLSAISILIFTVLWVKGRSLSSGERIDLAFNDINGMRAGSAVQMMGLRIGQVEEITPVMAGKDSHVKLRFVVTEKGVKIPYASTISIQQSGIIGEQFLEVTPPKVEFIYSETSKSSTIIKKDDSIYMELSEGVVEVGKVVEVEILKKSQLPNSLKQKFNTKNIIKLSYLIDLPGLVVNKDAIGLKIENGKILIYMLDGEILQTPKKDLKYTVVEPIRLAEFMDLGFRATKAMLETNDKITEILSDEFIDSIKSSAQNIQTLTASANTTLDKAAALIDSSKKDIEGLISQSEQLIDSLTVLSNNVNTLITDEALKNDVLYTIKSIGKMSDNVNRLISDAESKDIIENIETTTRNITEISSYVNEFTKNEQLREDITKTVGNLANITQNISRIMDDYNRLEDSEKMKLKGTIKEINTITKNLSKFSEKLNKRFLLFRLMF